MTYTRIKQITNLLLLCPEIQKEIFCILVKKYAHYLKLKETSDEWYEFFDLAAAESGRLPKELREKEIVARMPFLFRTIRGKKISKEKLDKLIKLIKTF